MDKDFQKSLWTKGYQYDELNYIKEFVDSHSKHETPEYLKTIAATT